MADWLPLTEFLRGGYRHIKGPTVVAYHGRPAFTVFPHDDWTSKRAQQVAAANLVEMAEDQWNALPTPKDEATDGQPPTFDWQHDNELEQREPASRIKGPNRQRMSGPRRIPKRSK